MKKVITLFFIATALTYADSIDDIVNKIKSQRESKIDKKELSNINSPIPTVVVVETNSSKKDANKTVVKMDSETFVLKAIMNNRAFINNEWVKVGEKIGSYTLVDIMDDSVYLKDRNRSKMIFFKTKNSKIKITGR